MLLLPRQRGRTGFMLHKRRDDQRISQGLQPRTGLVRSESIDPVPGMLGTGSDPQPRLRSLRFSDFLHGIKPGPAIDTWDL